MKKIVILGGGYGGITVAKELLENDFPQDSVIVLVDRMPYQGLKTEYYALAAGTLSDMDIRVAFPSDPRLIIKHANITKVDMDSNVIHFSKDESISYDWLVIALGSTDRYHDIPGANAYSCSVQSLSETRKTYQQLNDISPYGQVSIVGGGLSGVEIAAELRESRKDLNIRIVDRGPCVLSSFPNKLQDFVKEWFLEHDVELLPQINLNRVEEGILHNEDKEILTDVTVWTAGIQSSPIVQKLAVHKDALGRVLLNDYHQIPAYENIFVVGDNASLPFAPSGQLAEAQGKQVAEFISTIWKGETPSLAKLKLKGVLGSLGKKSGFAVMGKRRIVTGRVPRMLKSGILWKSKQNFG